MPCTSSCRAALTTSSTERLCPRWITSQPIDCRMRRMMLMDASWPSNNEAAVTKRTLLLTAPGSLADVGSAARAAERSVMSPPSMRCRRWMCCRPHKARRAGRLFRTQYFRRLRKRQPGTLHACRRPSGGSPGASIACSVRHRKKQRRTRLGVFSIGANDTLRYTRAAPLNPPGPFRRPTRRCSPFQQHASPSLGKSACRVACLRATGAGRAGS